MERKTGKLIVFLQTNQFTGAVCNPGLTAEDAFNLCERSPPNEFPICIKREGLGKYGVTIDLRWSRLATKESLISLLTALENIEPLQRTEWLSERIE